MSTQIVVFTGAGTSAPSGLPTYRSDDKTGLWNQNQIEDVCHMRSWEVNPGPAKMYWNAFRKQVQQAAPNAFHYGIQEWQDEARQKGWEFVVVTTNVDDLLERAGVRSVYHVHGCSWKMRCCSCKKSWDVAMDYVEPARVICPNCCSPNCKPDVTFFGGDEGAEWDAGMEQLEQLQSHDFLMVCGSNAKTFDVHAHLERKNRPHCWFNALDLPPEQLQAHVERIWLESCVTALPKMRNQFALCSLNC